MPPWWRVRPRAFSRGIRASRVPADHGAAEVREFLDPLGRAGVVRPDAARIRREAEGERGLEILERPHLTVEPLERPGSMAVRPAQSGAKAPYAEPLQPAHDVVQPGVFIVDPLADAERGGVLGEPM